ncbi:MAG: SDR family NAD(P)-dependent oxidoreductase, partial [Gammaproteobacteria bacterium]
MDFDGKAILVTGAARGIGRACAEAFTRLGGKVAVHYHTSRDAAERLVTALPGTDHHAIGADLSDPAACQRLVDEVVRHYGRLDVLVNNAGIYAMKPLKESSYSDWQATWRSTLGTNLIAPANLCLLTAQVMIKQ